MRTTLSLQPHLAQEIESRRKATGRSLKRVVNDLLRAGVEHTRAGGGQTEPVSFTSPHSCGGILIPLSEIDSTGEILARMDEEELGVAR